MSGLVQGLGSELGFIVTKNRYESWLSLTANSIGITLVSFVYEYIKLGYYAFSLPFVLSLLVVRFISVFFFCTILVRAIVKLSSSVCNRRKSIDGAGITGDSVPNFSEPIDFTFHGQAFTLLVWEQWIRKIESLSNDCPSQFSSL